MTGVCERGRPGIALIADCLRISFDHGSPAYFSVRIANIGERRRTRAVYKQLGKIVHMLPLEMIPLRS